MFLLDWFCWPYFMNIYNIYIQIFACFHSINSWFNPSNASFEFYCGQQIKAHTNICIFVEKIWNLGLYSFWQELLRQNVSCAISGTHGSGVWKYMKLDLYFWHFFTCTVMLQIFPSGYISPSGFYTLRKSI